MSNMKRLENGGGMEGIFDMDGGAFKYVPVLQRWKYESELYSKKITFGCCVGAVGRLHYKLSEVK